MDNNKNSDFLNKLLSNTQHINKLKKDYFFCIENNDFEGFIKNIKIYLQEVNKDKADEKFKYKIESIRELMKHADNKNFLNRIIDFFYRGELISRKNILLALWMSESNEDASRNNQNFPVNKKYTEFFECEEKITKKYYTAFYEIFNKNTFKKEMNNFFEAQSKYLFNKKLNKNLIEKPYKPSNVKI